MIRPHPPNESPAEKPCHSGEEGAWVSPWALDEEWRDAPKAKRGSALFANEAAAPPPPSTSSPDAVPAPQATPGIKKITTAESPTPHMPVLGRASALRAASAPLRRANSWGTLVFLSMGALVFAFIAWTYLEDEKTVGFDQDLLLRPPIDQAPTISTPEKLRKFLDSLKSFDAPVERRPPWLWDTPTLARAMQSNGVALDNLRDLLEDADWHPHHSSWHAEDLGNDPRWHQAMLLKQVEAAYLSRRRLEEDAFTAAIDLAEIGWRLEQMLAWPSFYQRSLEAHMRAAQTLADLLRQTKLPENTLRQFQRQFSVCQPSTEMLVERMNAAYVHEKKLILGPKSGENLDTMPGGVQLQRPGRLLFKPHATVRLFAEAFRQLRDEAKAPLAQTSDVRLKNAPEAEGGLKPNAQGGAYFMQRMKIYTPLPAFLGLARARGNLIITLFAVRRCIAEKKALPSSLDQLRSLHFLLDVPLDPFTGAPLHYEPSRGRIWSVGNDLKSAGGKPTEPPMEDATEPTLEIGVAVANAVK